MGEPHGLQQLRHRVDRAEPGPDEHLGAGQRAQGRQNTTVITAAARTKRTARKSAGSWRTTSLTRKNVEPQMAVMPTSTTVADRVERSVVVVLKRP